MIPQVSGTVSEVLVTPNQLIKAGSILFKIDPTVYQARVDRLTADLVKAEQQVKSQQAQLTASQSEVERATAERDKALKDLGRYQRAAGKAVNPFTEQEATNAKQAYLAQEANLATARAQRCRCIALDAMVDGENASVVSLRAHQVADHKKHRGE